MNLTSLPEQFLLGVFNELSTYEKICLSKTCSHFRDLLFYPSLWKNFCLKVERKSKKGEEEANIGVKLFFEKIPFDSVVQIIWKLNNVYFETLLTLCIKHKMSLQHLQIVDEKLNNEQMTKLCDTLKSDNENTSSSLSHIGITGSSVFTGDALMSLQSVSKSLNSLGMIMISSTF